MSETYLETILHSPNLTIGIILYNPDL